MNTPKLPPPLERAKKRTVRKIRIAGDVAYVPLTRGLEAIIDACDVDLVNSWNWNARKQVRRDGSIRTFYAVRTDENQKMIFMHRVIAGTMDGVQTDHKDGNGLNNRRENLRDATRAENQRNCRKPSNNTSGVKGVSWHKTRNKWMAKIKFNGKMHFLGRFERLQDASDAYARASAEMHKEFGRTQ